MDHSSEEITFRISKMEEIYEERKGEPDTPHRHDYYTVLLSRKANGKHFVDFREYPLVGSQVFFLSPGQVHQVVEFEKSFGYVIVFSPDFLVTNNIPPGFIDDLNLFNEYGQSPPLSLNPDEMKNLSQLCEEMISANNSDIKFKAEALGSYLRLFLIQCNNLCNLSFDNPQDQEAGNTILRNFKDLVDTYHTKWHSAAEYAEALSVTPDYLTRVVKSLTGRTAKEHILARIVLSAKRMLYFTDLSAKEIGFQLGFSEPANFSATFKKITGKSPSGFRNNP